MTAQVHRAAAPPQHSETLSAAEVADLRAQFAILDQAVNGHPLVYLDWGATGQRPARVLDAERAYSTTRNAAVHRGAHTLAAEATEQFEAARARVARFLGAGDDELVWTSNATEALNLVAYAIGNASAGRGGSAAERFRVGPGDEIVVTELEHHANLVPWQELAARTGATLRFVPIDDTGALASLDVITERTRLVAFSHASNVLGTIQPVGQIVAAAHRVGAFTVLDACQSAPHIPFDFAALGVDFAAVSSHKLLGPTGIGALLGRRELLEALPPFLTGGSMITSVTMHEAEYLPPPQRFEAGTQRISQAIGFAAAIDFLDEIGMERVAAHEAALSVRLLEGLGRLEGVRVLGADAPGRRVGLAAVDVRGIHAHDLGQALDARGVAVRVGHHCAQPLHRRLGITASTRASTHVVTTEAEIDEYLAALADSIEFFRSLL